MIELCEPNKEIVSCRSILLGRLALMALSVVFTTFSQTVGVQNTVQANLQRSMCRTHNSSDLEAGSSKADGPTIQDLLDAGEDVASSLCQLTNEIHPIFQAENMCVCQYDDIRCCVQPHFADLASRDPEIEKAHPIASPYPEDNIIVLAAMQLASRILTHVDTLPFWVGILDCIDPDTGKVSSDFKVHPSKHLSPQRNVKVLDHLSRFAERVRFHHKANEVSRTLGFRIDVDDPDSPEKASNSYNVYEEVSQSSNQGFRVSLT